MKRAATTVFGLAALAIVSGGSAKSGPAPAASPQYTYALGAFDAERAVPEPGSYFLPVIQRIRDHPLLDSSGRPTTLFALKGARISVVAFVYGSCAEARGCPFSMAVLHRLDSEIAADPELARRVALLTLSFDPERDTPTRMAALRDLHRPKSDWAFATTSGDAELQELLTDFGQAAAKLRFADGRWSGLYRHVLKVFLVDEDNRVRNIYSVGFLDPQLLLADLRTLAEKRELMHR